MSGAEQRQHNHFTAVELQLPPDEVARLLREWIKPAYWPAWLRHEVEQEAVASEEQS